VCLGVGHPATDREAKVFGVGGGIAVVVPTKGFELVEDVDTIEVEDQLISELGIDGWVARVLGKSLKIADDRLRAVVHGNLLSTRSDGFRCVVDVLLGDLKPAVQSDKGEGINGDGVDKPWCTARDLMESGNGSVGEEIRFGADDVEVMADVGGGAVFVKRSHFKAEGDPLVDMSEHRASEANGQAFMTGEDNDHRIKGVHLEVEEHRQLDEGFLRDALGIVEDDDGESTGGVDPVADGDLEVGEELCLAVRLLPGELLVEVAEEVVWADLLLHIMDVSSPQAPRFARSVEQVLTEVPPFPDENDEVVYTLSNRFLKGYFNYKDGVITDNPAFDPEYRSPVFDRNLEKIKKSGN